MASTLKHPYDTLEKTPDSANDSIESIDLTERPQVLICKRGSRRTQHVAITLGIATLFALFLYYVFRPSYTLSSWPSGRAGSYAKQINGRCNPYELRGILNLNKTDVEENKWQPFDEGCQPENWMAKVRAYVNSSLSSEDDSGVEWMRNKTILQFSDSLAHYLTEDICRYIGYQANSITFDHPAYPEVDESWWKDEDMTHDFSQPWGQGRPTVCHIPKLNFTAVALYHFSLATTAEMRAVGLTNWTHYRPPAQALDRFQLQALPLLHNLGRDLDLLSFSALLWDAQYIGLAEEARFGDVQPHVDLEAVKVYQGRLRSILESIASLIPAQTPMLWRSQHYVSVSYDNAVRAPIIWALRHAADSVIESLTGRHWDLYSDPQDADFARSLTQQAPLTGKLRVAGIGSLNIGYEDFNRDRIHFGLEQNYVAVNQLLEELRRGPLEVDKIR